ncbi:FtsX-like permease family protein [Mycoplasmoides genitalium]
MFSFFKQIFKSLKKFFFLLFGIIFVLFSIIFLETSIVQLSNNLVSTYTTLVSKTNSSDIVAPAILKEANPVYTASLTNDSGYFSKIKIDDKKINYLFPYQENDFGSDSGQSNGSEDNQNKTIPRKGDVNEKDKLFLARKRGILKAYGEANIAEKRIYKGLAVSFNNTDSFNGNDISDSISNRHIISDPQNLIYDASGNLLGYFADGLIKETISLRAGIARFPGDKGKSTGTQIKITQKQQTNTDPQKDNTVNSLYKTNNKDKVWFKSDETKADNTDISANYLFTGGNEAANWFPNLYANIPIDLEIDPGSQFWKDVNPFKEIVEEFQTQKESKDNQSFTLTFNLDISKLNKLDNEQLKWLETNAKTIANNSSFGDWDLENKLKQLKKFELKINKDWLKKKVESEKDTILNSLPGFSDSDKDTIFKTQNGMMVRNNNLSFQPSSNNLQLVQNQNSQASNGIADPNFSNVQTAYNKIHQPNNTPEKTLDAVYAAVLDQWRSIFQEDLVKKTVDLLEKYRDHFLKATAFNNIDYSKQNIAIANNVSSAESASFLVSNKDEQRYNDLSLIDGVDLKSWLFKPEQNESNPLDTIYGGQDANNGFLQKIDYEFKPSTSSGGMTASLKNTQALSPKSTKFPIYPKLANIIAQAQLPEATNIPTTALDALKQWTNLDANGFNNLKEEDKRKAANNYLALLSYFTPAFQDPNELIETNRQMLEIPITVKNGVNPLILPTDQQNLVVQTPEAHGAVVSQQWLFRHNKEILPQEGEYAWKTALQTPNNFPNWLNDLPDRYKFSINGLTFAILGIGESVETGYPVLSLQSPLPNTQDEALIFVNDQAYRSILFAVPAANQENYYAFKSTDLKQHTDQDPVQFIANRLEGYLDVPRSDLAFNVKDISKFNYLTTARNYFPDLVQSYLAIVSTVIAIFLIILALYLIILLIKSFIKKNQTEFSIIRAGGFSTTKFIVGMSVFAGIVAIVSSFLGVLFAFLLEGQVKGIINRYWFIALPENSFNWLSFFGSFFITFFVFEFISWIAFKQLFSKPVNVLIDQGNETKFSVLLHLLKHKSHTMSPLTKFRVSLIVSRFSRLFTYVGLSSVALLLIGIAGTIPQKFSAAQTSTSLNRNFNYKLNLQTPTEQSGWYAIQPYSHFGVTDNNNGIKTLYNESVQANSQNEHPYKPSNLKLKNRQDQPIKAADGTELELGNLLLPSYGGAQQLSTDENFFRHASLSKWIIDFPIRVGGSNINPWEIVEKSIPKQITQLLSASSDQFLISVLTDDFFNNLNANGFLIRNPRTNQIQLDASRVLTTIDVFNPGGVKFNDSFLSFMLKVYGDFELAKQDSKLNFGIVPVDPAIEETYTYVEGPFGFQEDNLDENSPYTLTGINPESSFVNLIDGSGNSLRNLISSDQEMNVIVNAGFQYANNINIGDYVYIKPKNTATRYSEKFLKATLNNPTVAFKVVGVSTDAFGQELYINQHIANNLLKLSGNQGRGIIRDVIKKTNGQSQSNEEYEIDYVKPNGYVPFNGVFSKELKPSLLNKALVLNSIIGVWGNFTDFGNNFQNLVRNKLDKVITSILPTDPEIINKLAQEKQIINTTSMNYESLRKELVNKYKTEWNSVNLLSQNASSIFGNNIIAPVLNIDAAGTSVQIIRNNAEVLFNTVNQVDAFLLGTIIPFIFITCVVLGISMLEEMKRIFISLKAIGYRDVQNLISLLTFFIPAFVLALLISIGVLAGVLIGIQAVVFNVAQVFLTNVFEFLPYMVGIVLFGVTIFVIGSYFWIKLRSAELKEGF